jgi:uncharacterized protein GlcG (DUF336 family)
MAQVKSFEVSFANGNTQVVEAFSLDQAKSIVRESLGVARLPNKTVFSKGVAVAVVNGKSETLLLWDKEEKAKAKAKAKANKSITAVVFIFKLKDGREIEIAETAQDRAKAKLREVLGVSRLPNGTTFEKVEKIVERKMQKAA